MDDLAHRPKKGEIDVEDLACDFVENEVGRFDFKNNWPKFKANLGDKAALQRKVQAWLNFLGIDHDPDEIIDCLDDFAKKRTGNWR